MISYELAKELKEAGFPQGEKFEKIMAYGTAMAYLRVSKPDAVLLEKYEKALDDLRDLYRDDQEVVYLPTLSEFIEACGLDFWALQKWNGAGEKEWVATNGNGDVDLRQGHGSTPKKLPRVSGSR